jgi:hypothetical protein
MMNGNPRDRLSRLESKVYIGLLSGSTDKEIVEAFAAGGKIVRVSTIRYFKRKIRMKGYSWPERKRGRRKDPPTK